MTMNSLQIATYSVATIAFVLGTASIFLRIYSRAFIVQSFKLDDWFMTSILFFSAGQQAIIYIFMQYGGGQHIAALSTDSVLMVLRVIFAELFYYTFMHWIIKTTILLFYIRLIPTQTFKYWTIGAIILNTALTLSLWLLFCLQCEDIRAAIQPLLYPNVKCIKSDISYYTAASFCIFADFIVLTLPLRPLWNIQASFNRRLGLICIVTLGGCSPIISLVRLVTLVEFGSDPDLTYPLAKLLLASAVEIQVAIMAANAPSLKAIWRKHVTHSLGSAAYPRPSNQNSHELSDVAKPKKSFLKVNPLQSLFSMDERTQTEIAADTSLGQGDSNEQLFQQESAIMVTSSVAVESQSVPSVDMKAPHSQYSEV